MNIRENGFSFLSPHTGGGDIGQFPRRHRSGWPQKACYCALFGIFRRNGFPVMRPVKEIDISKPPVKPTEYQANT